MPNYQFPQLPVPIVQQQQAQAALASATAVRQSLETRLNEALVAEKAAKEQLLSAASAAGITAGDVIPKYPTPR